MWTPGTCWVVTGSEKETTAPGAVRASTFSNSSSPLARPKELHSTWLSSLT